MMPLFNNFHVVIPELLLLVTACFSLLVNLFLREKAASATWYVALAGLLITSFCNFLLFGHPPAIALNGLFLSNQMSVLMNAFILMTVFFCLTYSNKYYEFHQLPAGDCYVLSLLSALGMMVLVSSYSLLTLYLGLELLSLPLYAMTAVSRHSGNSSEAAMKYFVMGAIASGMLLYGFSLLYGATGHLNLTDIANGIAVLGEDSTLITFALVFILAGIGFKLAAAPFHMWAPDVYDGAPTVISLFISAAPKIAAMGLLLRLLTIAFSDMVFQWQGIILVMALLSMAIGNILAVVQTNIKRLLAYSAIAHAGYALLGVLPGTAGGYSSALYYVLIYALMTSAALGLVSFLSTANKDIIEINDLKGLSKRNPWIAFMMLIILFSMAGVPPTVGFLTKFFVLKAVVDAQLTWVAILGVLFAVIGAYYYIYIIKVMYFDESVIKERVVLSRPLVFIFSCNSLALLYLGLFPSYLLNACLVAFSK